MIIWVTASSQLVDHCVLDVTGYSSCIFVESVHESDFVSLISIKMLVINGV